MITGVDVSSYQDSTYDISGQSFAIVKATESTNYTNPEYTAQVAYARNAGLVVGHYHYLSASGDAAAEFAYFASVARVVEGDIIALDWEASDATAGARDEWLNAAQSHFPRNKVVLYCDVDYWVNHDPTHSAADGLWIADYNGGSRPNISQPWVFWQYSSANNLDHSYGNFSTLAQLVTWCLALEPAPPNTIEDEDMTVASQNGQAGLVWSTGTRHSFGVNYDGAAPTLRVVACLKTGAFVLAEAWVPQDGCDAFQVPAAHVSACQGVIVEATDANARFYIGG